jgi:tetratricopeptide (TPR) repeat protein
MMKARLALLAAIVAGGLLVSPAGAQPTNPAKKERARALFNAGVDAYKQGQFIAAAQAFTQAHEQLPRPQLLFSIGQAFRRSFDAKQDEQHLVQAVKYYRAYLDAVPEGGRRLEATKALGDLRPYMQRMGADVSSAGTMRFPTRLSVRSPVDKAVVVVDGGEVHALPYTATIEPGRHRIELHASGYKSEVRSFDARAEETVPFDIQFKGIVPTIEVAGADGADVTIDGRLLGEAPFTQPLGVSTGRHFVTVERRGHEAYGRDLDFDYGSSTTLEVDLPATNQRRVAWGVLASGGAGFVASGVLFGLALAAESNATSIRDQQASATISDEERIDYNDSVDRRDDFVLAGGIAAGVSGAIAATGLFLYLFDEAEVPLPSRRGEDDVEDATPGEEEPSDVDVMGAPVLGPGVLGFGLTGRF